MNKQFSFAAVMSVITCRHLASTLDEQYDLLRHLTGDGTIGSRPDGQMLYKRAQDVLFKQFPNLADGYMQFATGELILMLQTEVGRQSPSHVILGWLSQQAARLHMDLDKPISIKGIESSADDKVAKAIDLAVQYKGGDEAHHKDWVIDQMVRILAGDDYDKVVCEAKAGEDGPETYAWDVGIAP